MIKLKSLLDESNFTSKKRIHISNSKSLEFIGIPTQRVSKKPVGMWYAFGNSWINSVNEPQKHN